MFNHQEVFDKVVAHLRQMPERARVSFGALSLAGWCVYRSPKGLKCAVGVLIPDELYSSNMENNGSVRENTRVLEALKETFGHSLEAGEVELLAELQNAHDFMGNWNAQGFCNEDDLRQIAEDYNLTYTAP